MSAYFKSNLNAPLNGTYTFDSVEKSKEFINGFTILAKDINPDIYFDISYVAKTSKIQRLFQSVKSYITFFIVLGLTTFLILLNISSVTSYWMEGRKSEISIRMLSGGKTVNIMWLILRDYLFIIIIGYSIGVIVGIAYLFLGEFVFIGKTIHPISLIVALGACVLIGVTAGIIILNNKLKQSIVSQMKG